MSTTASMEKSDLSPCVSSKLVPSVQELAKEPLLALPPRYIRDNEEHSVVTNTELVSSVPVIDMQKLLSGKEMELELEKLHMACKEWGFFQLLNHGVNSVLVERVKQDIHDLFELPLEQKNKFWQSENELEGFGQAFVLSDEQKLDWGDMFFMTMHPKYLRKPHLFPNLPEHFRETLDAYSLEVKNLAMMIFRLLGKALKINPKEIADLFDDGFQSMRMNYYPPCPMPDKVIGLTPHSDAGGLTILLQVNELDGLQIRKDGMWLPIKPLQDAFVVNIGDILEIVTNGIYRSIEHRATVNNMKARLSIATFHSPGYDIEFGPLWSLATQPPPALYRRIKMGDYYKGLLSQELSGKSYLDVMKIENEKT